MSQVHPQARTTPLIRAEIKAATGTQAELAARYNVRYVFSPSPIGSQAGRTGDVKLEVKYML